MNHRRWIVYKVTFWGGVMWLAAACFVGSGMLSKWDASHKRSWIGAAFCFFAAAIFAGNTDTIRSGRYQRGFRTVERSQSPREFWSTIVFGYVVAIATSVLGTLVALGVIGGTQ